MRTRKHYASLSNEANPLDSLLHRPSPPFPTFRCSAFNPQATLPLPPSLATVHLQLFLHSLLSLPASQPRRLTHTLLSVPLAQSLATAHLHCFLCSLLSCPLLYQHPLPHAAALLVDKRSTQCT